LREIRSAIAEMPRPMRQLALAMLCQWYAMMVYWQYIAFALSRSLHGTADAATPAFRDAALTAQQLGAVYNAVAFVAALALIPVVRRLGARAVHVGCLAAAGLAMIAVSSTASLPHLALLMVGIGLGWAGMMGNTYVMLADSIPPARNGVYMGIFNMFIVIPMLVESLTMPLIYGPVLGGDARNALILAGLFMLLGAGATLFVGTGGRPSRSR
jgi:maltose/moltooligosaccharide transporter